MNSKEFKAMALLLVTPLLFPVSVVASGYALAVLWGWFVVPTFHFPELSVPVAYGLWLIIGYMTYQEVDPKGLEEKSAGVLVVEALIKAVLRPAFALAMGWVVHLFV